MAPVLSDLEVNHLRRFSLTWELLSKHLYQVNSVVRIYVLWKEFADSRAIKTNVYMC